MPESQAGGTPSESFRHGTRLIRWRPDKPPRQCTLDQLLQKNADPMTLLKSAA